MRFILITTCLLLVSLMAAAKQDNEKLGQVLNQLHWQTGTLQDASIKQFTQIVVQGHKSTQIVADYNGIVLTFEILSDYTNDDYQKLSKIYQAQFTGGVYETFVLEMNELMKKRGCQKDYLPYEIHTFVSHQFPTRIFRSFETNQKGWNSNCKKETTNGARYWGVFYNSKSSEIVRYKIQFFRVPENQKLVMDFLHNLNPV